MRRRLLVSYLTITLFTLLALVYPLGRTFASRERDRLLRDIEHDTTVVANMSEDALERGEPPPIDDLLARYRRDPGGRIVVVDPSGISLADSDTPGVRGVDFSNRPEITDALAGRRAEGVRHSRTAGGDLVFVALPVTSSGVVHGAVRITYPSSTLDARVRAMWIGLGVLSLIVTAAVAVVGFLLARTVTLPVERLKRTARSMAGGDLSVRADTTGGAPELRELAQILNESAARLSETLAAQQAFVADASHQLRTPLAALRLQLENLESDAPPALQSGLAAARAETARLSRISEALLALTRAAGAATPCEPVDAAAIARERCATWETVTADAEVGLALHAPAHAWVLAAPGALDQILDNLIDNALDVSRPGSTIRVEVESSGDTAAVHVIDEGRGLTPEHRRRAFDRFWRGPDAAPGGTGLGLAIVEQLASRCDGRAELRAAPTGGVDAVVTFHAAHAPDTRAGRGR